MQQIALFVLGPADLKETETEGDHELHSGGSQFETGGEHELHSGGSQFETEGEHELHSGGSQFETEGEHELHSGGSQFSGPRKGGLAACFRVSGIPPLWDGERLEQALRTIDPEFDLMDAEISGPFPDHDSTQTALLNLSGCTSYFTFDPNQEKHKIIYEGDRKIHLVLDKHFYDLTPLNRAEEPIKMELVNLQKGAFQILTCVSTA